MTNKKVFQICVLFVFFAIVITSSQLETHAKNLPFKDVNEAGGFKVYLPFVSKIFSCGNVSEIPTIECEALVALYHSTDGNNWVYNDNWLKSDTPCTWLGISCSDGHVATINMVNNNLSGPIAPEIGNLEKLITFQSVFSHITGSIPIEFSNLTDLSSIILYENQLTGPIPPELGGLSNLETLGLGHNQLSGSIPSAIGNLQSLETLQLQDNQLSGLVPAELANLTNLESMYLYENQLGGPLPQSFINLNLNWFWFYDTNLCEPTNADFQTWLGSINNLQSTDILCK